MNFNRKIFNFFLIPFVGFTKVFDRFRVFLFLEMLITFLLWESISLGIKKYWMESTPVNSFFLFIFCYLFTWFCFSDSKPNDRQSLSQLKSAIGFNQFKLIRNSILIFVPTLYFLSKYFSL